jgi:hypothetical protein
MKFIRFDEVISYRNQQLLRYEGGEISVQEFRLLVRKAIRKYRRGLTLEQAYRLERGAEAGHSA